MSSKVLNDQIEIEYADCLEQGNWSTTRPSIETKYPAQLRCFCPPVVGQMEWCGAAATHVSWTYNYLNCLLCVDEKRHSPLISPKCAWLKFVYQSCIPLIMHTIDYFTFNWLNILFDKVTEWLVCMPGLIAHSHRQMGSAIFRQASFNCMGVIENRTLSLKFVRLLIRLSVQRVSWLVYSVPLHNQLSRLDNFIKELKMHSSCRSL